MPRAKKRAHRRHTGRQWALPIPAVASGSADTLCHLLHHSTKGGRIPSEKKYGGGYHIPPKGAFKGAAAYDVKAALAMPNEELARLNVRHFAVTGAQKSLYREFAKTGANLT